MGEVQPEECGEDGPRGERGDAVAGEVEVREGAEIGKLGRDLLEEIRAQVELGEAGEAGGGGNARSWLPGRRSSRRELS